MEADRVLKTPATGSPPPGASSLGAGHGAVPPFAPQVPVIELGDALAPAPVAAPRTQPPRDAGAAVSWLIADELGEPAVSGASAPAPSAAAGHAAARAALPESAGAGANARPGAAALGGAAVAAPRGASGAPAPAAPGTPALGKAAPGDARSAQLADDLFGDVVVPEAPTVGVAPAVSESLVDDLRVRAEGLERARQQLLEQKRAAEAEPQRQEPRQSFERARADAQSALEAACNVIEELPDDELIIEARRELVDAYFRLERVVSPEVPVSEADAAAAASRARRMQRLGKTKAVGSRTRGPARAWSRSTKLGVFLGVAVVARLAYFFAVESQPQTTGEDEVAPPLPGGVVVRPAPPTSRPLRSRSVPPEVRMVVLSQNDEGLRVVVSAASDSPASLSYSYTWWENGKIFAEGREARLPAKTLTRGARYRVEIEVADDKGRTMAKTEELVYGQAATAAPGAPPTRH